MKQRIAVLSCFHMKHWDLLNEMIRQQYQNPKKVKLMLNYMYSKIFKWVLNTVRLIMKQKIHKY